MVASLSLALAVAFLGHPLEEGTLHTYRGSFQAVKVDQPSAGKSFELTLLVGPSENGVTDVYWHLADSSGKPIPWNERWGRVKWSPKKRTIEGETPSFPFEHPSGTTRVNIAIPLPLFDHELSAGATWNEGKIEFEVQEGNPVAERETLAVIARTLIGRSRTMTVDQEDHRVYSLRENVFVGQGQEHLLKYQLTDSNMLEAESLNKTLAAFAAWTKLREEWKAIHEDASPGARAKAGRVVSGKLPQLQKDSEGTFLAALAQVVANQTKGEAEQSAALDAMRKSALGKSLPAFDLNDASNKAWSNAAMKNKVVVLHFWTYRDENLHEPYGQVGYLDFIARRNDPAQVQVVGVAIASENPDERLKQRSAVRRFRDFMNVSYPILLDDGSLLKKLGDPRAVERELPLFVVVDARGNVVEYKAGLYDVKRDEGLAELQATIKKALTK
jgi:hypothetical protein